MKQISQISTFLPLLLILTLLQGCSGGGSSSSTNSVRLVNGTSSTWDMVSGTTVLASGVAPGTASAYATMASGTLPIELASSGIPSTQTNFSFSAGVPYTLLAYTSYQATQPTQHLAAFTDNAAVPASGYGELRIADLSTDAGSLDVYLAVQSSLDDTYSPNSPTGSVALSSATQLLLNFSGTSGYTVLPQNTYHIWVTGAGNKSDLRLDIPSIVIGNQQILTLALTGTTGGALVDGMLITQQGAVVAQQNGNARIRIAANTTTALTSATAASVDLLGGLTTGFNASVGSYVLVPAGAEPIALSSGPACTSPTATHGEDLTLLVTATTCTVLADDNTRPLSGYSKLRLVNAVNGSGSLSLTLNSQTVASNIALGAASVPTTGNGGIVTSGFNMPITVNTSPTFSLSAGAGLTLSSQHIYSLFMFNPTVSPYFGLTQDN